MLPSPLAPSGFNQTIATHLQAAASLLEALQEWLETRGVSVKESLQVTLMVDELVTNTILHGYPTAFVEQSGTIGCITVTADIITLASPALPGAGDKAIVLTLTDNALAFNPLSLPGPDLALGLEERSIGGLGVHFVRQLADDIAYQRHEPLGPSEFFSHNPCRENTCAQGNQLRITKRLQVH